MVFAFHPLVYQIFFSFNYLNIYGGFPFQFWNWSYFNGGTVHLKLEDQ